MTKEALVRRKISHHMRAADVFGRKIASGEFKPGATIPNATDLARQMSISRPAVREAIKLLTGKGLLESIPRRGTVVRPRSGWNSLDPDVLIWRMGDAPNAAFIRDLYELRRIVEPEAAALAATRASSDRLLDVERALLQMEKAEPASARSVTADVAFHLSILIASGNDFLCSFAPAIRTSLTMMIKFQRSSCPGLSHFLPDHQRIYDALRRGNPDAARAAVRQQLAQGELDAIFALNENVGGEERSFATKTPAQ